MEFDRRLVGGCRMGREVVCAEEGGTYWSHWRFCRSRWMIQATSSRTICSAVVRLDGGWDSHTGCCQSVSRCDVSDCNFKALILYQGEHATEDERTLLEA